MISLVGLAPLILLVPSQAAAVELPRRLAATGRALAAVYPFKLLDLARALAEPGLLAAGFKAWNWGLTAMVAARLLRETDALALPADLPLAPVALTLARTLAALRAAALQPEDLERGVARMTLMAEDARRLSGLCALYRQFHATLEHGLADPARVYRAAEDALAETHWLAGTPVLVAGDLELDPVERAFLGVLASRVPVSFLDYECPPSLASASFAAWAASHRLAAVPGDQTLLAPLFTTGQALPPGLRRLRERLFELPQGAPAGDASVQLITAPSEAAEVSGVLRRLLRAAARGVAWEEMGVILARPELYAPLFADLMGRLEIPFRLHPSLPLRFGRAARSLLLLLRCRGLERAAVLELLTFAPVPFAALLGEDRQGRPARWERLSREAGIVSGIERWIIGLRYLAEKERERATGIADPARQAWVLQRAQDAEDLLRVVELLSSTLDGLAGEAAWPEWSERLGVAFEQWIGGGADREESLEREAVRQVLTDLAGLASVAPSAPFSEVEAVLAARFEWERTPLEPLLTGAVHVGAMDAMAGVPFRVVAIPGLVEGGFPGVLRPDPLLLDEERAALAAAVQEARATGRALVQLTLFADAPADTPAVPAAPLLPTTQDRLDEARRAFHRAVRQAGETLILSYPRADPGSGRARLPSLFFAAAAAAVAGRPLTSAELAELLTEDDLAGLPPADALDRSERDRARLRQGGPAASAAIAAGSPLYHQSLLATQARWSRRLTTYDGLVAGPQVPEEVRAGLDPLAGGRPLSASRLATYARCGFLYLLQYVLGLEPLDEPVERLRLDPLERGSLFHEVAERFLRALREQGQLPVRNDEAGRALLMSLADASLEQLVAHQPPRYLPLWARMKARFLEGLLAWLAREAAAAHKSQPTFFEVSFGMPAADPHEPHLDAPLEIEVPGGRHLEVCGRIDRIDRRPDGSLVVRDYKTGKAPRDTSGSLFRGARELQIPFYVLAAARLFPDQPVSEALLDYVDGCRQVSLDPQAVTGQPFKRLLQELVGSIGDGLFPQEHSACAWCDFTAVCGPQGLIEWRQRHKQADPRLARYLRLREMV